MAVMHCVRAGAAAGAQGSWLLTLTLPQAAQLARYLAARLHHHRHLA